MRLSTDRNTESVLATAFINSRQEPRQQPGQRQERTQPIDRFNTIAVGQIAKNCRRDPAKAEVQSIVSVPEISANVS